MASRTAGLQAARRIAAATVGRKWGSLLAFAGAAAFFHALVAVSFPSIGGMAAVTSVVSTFPPGLRTLLKLAPNLQAGFGLADYLAFSWLHPVFLGLGAAFVVTRATDALAGEVERGSIYLLLSRPLPRWSVVVGKALEMILGCGVIVLAGFLGQALGVAVTLPGALPPLLFLPVVPVAWALFAALGGGALLISAATGRTSLAGGIGSAWTLLAFVLDVIPAVAGSPLAVLNPWHWYFPQAIVAAGRVDVAALLALGAFTATTVLAAAWLFARRDLN